MRQAPADVRQGILAIVEYCDYDNREVYDQDNKSWKMIPNAIKGRVVKDDEQFRLDIGLFSKIFRHSRLSYICYFRRRS